MSAFVGHVARVTGDAGNDDALCPCVFVDVDGGAWMWRVRDLQRVLP